jgi:hypothetical protein
MLKRLFPALACTALLASASLPACAQENPKKDEAEKVVGKIIDLGPGVHQIKTDDKGRLLSCVVVGRATIHTVLGVEQGQEVARTQAQLAAKAEFTKWLRSTVTVREGAEHETTLSIEGSRDGDQKSLRESGKEVGKTTRRYELMAEGLVRGLQVLGVDVSEKNGTYTVVYGFTSAAADATQKVNGDVQGPVQKEDEKRLDEPKKLDNGKKPVEKKIQDKRVVSDDFEKFIN